MCHVMRTQYLAFICIEVAIFKCMTRDKRLGCFKINFTNQCLFIYETRFLYYLNISIIDAVEISILSVIL